MNFTWLWDIFRTILSLIDTLVYWLIELLISLFDQLANVRLFSDDVLKVFASRIYFLVSIVMVFKVSFSIIQYIINPDSISDNERGMGKIIQSVLLSLVCLVGVNYVFNFAYDLQNTILKSHVIEKLILGIDEGLTVNQQADVKSKIPYNLLTSFVRPNVNEVNLFGYDSDIGTYYCVTDISYRNNKDQWIYMYKYDSTSSTVDDETNYVLTNYNEQFGNCIENGAGNNSSNNRTFKTKDGEISGKTGKMYNYATQTNNYDLLLKLVNDKYKSETYIFEYKFIISTVAGVFVGIMYLNFCIDLAVRVSKFGFLQLIAPIPILSMIDPKSAKNGMMSKWVKNCINTYLGLFIRIAAVSFVVFIVNIIFTTNITDSRSGMEVGSFIKIVILFGGLLFAKEIPKLITDLTGIDMKGDFKMNPFSRIPVAGKAITGTAKAAGSLVGGAIGAAGHLGFAGLSAGAAALGSVGQAAFGAARGQGWNFNSDRIAREWKLGRDRILNSSIGGVNGALSNMGSIVGAKPKGIPTGSDRTKSANQEYREMQKKYNQGQKIEEQVAKMRAEAGQKGEELTDEQINNAIYTNSDFASDVTGVQSAKKEMISAENRYNELTARSNAGDMVATAELASASKNLADAKSRYNTRKEMLDKKGAQAKYASDYRRYEARKAYKDASDSTSNDNGPTDTYMRDYFSSSERPSVSSNQQPAGSMGSVTPPSRGGNGNNNSNP